MNSITEQRSLRKILTVFRVSKKKIQKPTINLEERRTWQQADASEKWAAAGCNFKVRVTDFQSSNLCLHSAVLPSVFSLGQVELKIQISQPVKLCHLSSAIVFSKKLHGRKLHLIFHEKIFPFFSVFFWACGLVDVDYQAGTGKTLKGPFRWKGPVVYDLVVSRDVLIADARSSSASRSHCQSQIWK